MRNRTPLRVVALGCAAFLAVFAIVWYSVLQLIAIRPDTGPIRPVLSGISAESCVWMTACDAHTRGFQLVIPADTLALMRAIKATFDPDGRLNPGRFVSGL